MKRALSGILCLSLGLGLMACSREDVPETEETEEETVEETEETVLATHEVMIAETTETTQQDPVINSMSIDEIADMLFSVVSIPVGCEYDYDDQLRNDGADPVNFRQYRIQNEDCYDGTTFNYTYSIIFQVFERNPASDEREERKVHATGTLQYSFLKQLQLNRVRN